MMNAIKVGVVLVVLAAVGGCANVAAVRVPGKVVAGDVSLVGVVEESDSRLDDSGTETGLAGVTVEILGTSGDARGVSVGKAVSDKNGNFTIRLMDPNAIKSPAEFRASSPGYLPATSSMLIPPPQRRVLVVLKRAR
jgi:hypothetical protein